MLVCTGLSYQVISIIAPSISLSENKDYMKLSRDLTLSPTTPEQCVYIDIIDDTEFEENEMMAMSVSEVQERVQISPKSANVFITDNDGGSI